MGATREAPLSRSLYWFNACGERYARAIATIERRLAQAGRKSAQRSAVVGNSSSRRRRLSDVGGAMSRGPDSQIQEVDQWGRYVARATWCARKCEVGVCWKEAEAREAQANEPSNERLRPGVVYTLAPHFLHGRLIRSRNRVSSKYHGGHHEAQHFFTSSGRYCTRSAVVNMRVRSSLLELGHDSGQM